MTAGTPVEQAEASLLGQLLLDEERRAANTGTAGPRLLEQLRSWGITSPALFGSGYHQSVWAAIQALAAAGTPATRTAVTEHLSANAEVTENTAAAHVPDESTHPAVAELPLVLELTDAAEDQDRPDRCAAMVVTGAMHRSVHDLGRRLAEAADEPEATAVDTVVEQAQSTVARMRAAWGRLPEQARVDLAALQPEEPTTLVEAQAELAGVRSWFAEFRADPAHAAQIAADPAWRALDTVLGVVDTLANTAVDAPRSPAHGNRVHLVPGQGLEADWVGYYKAEAAREAAEDEEFARRGMVEPDVDSALFPERAVDAEAAAERAQREGQLLGSLLAEPEQLGEITARVRPADLTDPARRETYALLTQMHDAGVVPDRLSLEWAASVRGLDAATVSAAVVEPLTPHDARDRLAHVIGTQAHGDRAHAAAERLRELGIDPATAPERLLERAEEAVAAIGPAPRELAREQAEPEMAPAETEVEEPAQQEPAAAPAAQVEEPVAVTAQQRPEAAESQRRETPAVPDLERTR